ncbi:hypothetical protein [Geopsychrobacter electrodiphilus]|uniref:hypothetical protein n=1 Tax=Geopsychrobacter electrodiphilus TaxID=225196 RepID=UPI0003812056|nr:hypothetical protein [Geopsychrobacter electrodiphilus]
MLLPPEFIINKCLNLRLDVEGRREIARIYGCGEPNVRRWLRDNSFPDDALEKITEHFEGLGANDLARDIQGISDEPYTAELAATKWLLFCQGMLAHKDVFLAGTIRELKDFSEGQISSIKKVRSLPTSQRFDAYKTYFADTLAPKFCLPISSVKTLQQGTDWESIRPVALWFAAELLIYFMAMAEVECLNAYYNIRESKLIEWVLPIQKKGKAVLPLRVFFGNFFDRCISRGDFPNLEAIAKKLTVVNRGDAATHITKDSALREIKRAKYQGKAPTFETVAAWFDALAPVGIYPTDEDKKMEKRLLLDGFGAARIFDGFYRDAINEISEEQLLSHFERYDDWYKFHSERFEKSGGEVGTPPPAN